MDSHELKQRYEQGDRNFQNADLSETDLSGLDLREADFSGADLYGAQLTNSLLCQANFSNQANLGYAKLIGTDLSGANLSGTNLEGAALDGAVATGAIYDQQTVFPLGFDPIAVGAIDRQELERQIRIAQTSLLKSQATQTQAAQPEPEAIVVPLSSATPTTDSLEEPSVLFPSTTDSTSPPTSTPTTAPPAKTSNSGLGIFLGLFLVLGLGFSAMNLFKPSTPTVEAPSNPFESAQYPQPACGDPLPSNANDYPVDLYPVYVNNSPETLRVVANQFCQDAFVKTRESTSIQSIQVASFTSQQRAEQFAQFMIQRVGSGEVGEPTRFFK